MVQELGYCERDRESWERHLGGEKRRARETYSYAPSLPSTVLQRPQASYLWTHYTCSLLTTAFFASPHAPRLGPTPLTQSLYSVVHLVQATPLSLWPRPSALPQQGKACSRQRPSPPGLCRRHAPFVTTAPAPLSPRPATGAVPPAGGRGLGETWSRVTLKARGADLLRNTPPNP